MFASDACVAKYDHAQVLRSKVSAQLASDYCELHVLKTAMRIEEPPAPQQPQDSIDKIIDEVKLVRKQDVFKNKIGLEASNPQMLVKRSPFDEDPVQASSVVAVHSDSKADRNSAIQLFDTQQHKRMGAILIDKIKKIEKPTWHAPWKLKRVIAGHQGWVRCLDFDATNEWFATGSTDRTIKFWDLASGKLKLSMTGHINTVRDVKISPTHTYLFSCSEDKTVRCWDLVQNKSIRNYHGHLSGVYTLAIHPTLNLLASGGRDATVRLWDMRTKFQVHCLQGHTDTVHSIGMQEFEPQCVSGSSDSTVRVWDIASGKRIDVLTNHKKSVRGLLFHPREYSFCSAAGDNLKVRASHAGLEVSRSQVPAQLQRPQRHHQLDRSQRRRRARLGCGQRHHVLLGLEVRLQLPAGDRPAPARLDRLRGWHLRGSLRPQLDATGHRRVRQDHQGLGRRPGRHAAVAPDRPQLPVVHGEQNE